MQEYEFEGNPSAQIDDGSRPSEQTLQNILGFARCFQILEVDGVQMEVYLN